MRSSVHLIFLRVPWAKCQSIHGTAKHGIFWLNLEDPLLEVTTKKILSGYGSQHSKAKPKQNTNLLSHPRINTILNIVFTIKCLFHNELMSADAFVPNCKTSWLDISALLQPKKYTTGRTELESCRAQVKGGTLIYGETSRSVSTSALSISIYTLQKW